MTTTLDTIRMKILSAAALSDVVRRLRSGGAMPAIVFTNGCFDIVHGGHVEYLAKAADMGNALIVGINSDASVRRLKGDSRPIIAQEHRALMLAAMRFVDYITIFDDDTPAQLIRTIMPDILVKGADYTAEQVAGGGIVSANGGKVALVALTEGCSTSGIVKRIKESS
jgi:rfaE bifunctional protein nucleotidyltransferase chain/domain